VNMNNPAGVFQIEEALERKIKASGLQELVEVIALEKGVKIERKEKNRKDRAIYLEPNNGRMLKTVFF
jgi:metal-dependent HD superfamily phosphatase/phosphodiesterase